MLLNLYRRQTRRPAGDVRPGHDLGVEQAVPDVGHAGEAPVDAVGVGARVGLLLRREDRALPDGVHGGVPVLAPLL